jgi:hypothetical protein
MGFVRPGMTGVLAALATAAVSPLPVVAADESFSYGLDIGPAWVRYEESGRREFAGLETEWADLALQVSQEARYLTPFDVASLLRFSFLTSLEDTETNNVGASTTQMRIAYLFGLQPGLQYELRPYPGITLAPELVWDLDWYLQVRKTQAGDVDESVFRHGPAPGLVVWLALADAWTVELGYRHSFLIEVRATNSFAEDRGFGTFTTEGDRDAASLRLIRRLSERWSARLGYRFESARVQASDTKIRTSERPAGLQTTQIQFPENDHTIHGGSLSLEARF